MSLLEDNVSTSSSSPLLRNRFSNTTQQQQQQQQQTTESSTTTTHKSQSQASLLSINSNDLNDLKSKYDGLTDIYKQLRVYICTWNVSTTQPSNDVDNLLKLNELNQDLPDIYVVGLQEVNSKPLQYILDLIFNDPWSNKLTDCLSKYDYIHLKSTRLVGILLNVYIKKSLISFIKYSIVDWIRLGFCGLWGNKGANLYCMKIGGFSLCFINSHLTAHEYNGSKRTKEYHKIVDKKLNFSFRYEPVLDQNYLFFFGDLNYRLNKVDTETIKEKINSKLYDDLLENDQLKKSISNGECFNGFIEGKIDFPPTYKFDPKTDTYDTSKKRRKPAWCDRIFYKISKNAFAECKIDEYNHINECKQSDHKPVFGIFKLKIFSLETQVPSVTFDEIKSNKCYNLEILYSVNEDVITHGNDWIGLYKPNFKTSNDYMTYVWAARIPVLEKSHKPTTYFGKKEFFSRTVTINKRYLVDGDYVLGYYSYVYDQLISLSATFQISVDWD